MPSISSHVWVIDDDDGILEVTKIVLEEEGYLATLIQNEKELKLKLSQDNLPVIILLDVLMSGVDGRDIAQRLRKNNSTKNIPIIMMSADTNIKEKALSAGVNDYIKKPFDIDEVITKIKLYL